VLTLSLPVHSPIITLFADADEQTAIEEWKVAARKELEDWNKHRNEQLEKTKATNL